MTFAASYLMFYVSLSRRRWLLLESRKVSQMSELDEDAIGLAEGTDGIVLDLYSDWQT